MAFALAWVAAVIAVGELAVNHRSRSGSPGFRSPCLLMWLPGTRPGAQWDSGSGGPASGAGRDIVAVLAVLGRVGQVLHGHQDANGAAVTESLADAPHRPPPGFGYPVFRQRRNDSSVLSSLRGCCRPRPRIPGGRTGFPVRAGRVGPPSSPPTNDSTMHGSSGAPLAKGAP